MAFANELRHVIEQMSLNTFHSDYLKKIIEESTTSKVNNKIMKKIADGKKANFKKIEISKEGLECIK